jgi:hypothetical protein
MGHQGFGCYGLNVGIGNIDDDKELEIIVTYDNHLINAFNDVLKKATARDDFREIVEERFTVSDKIEEILYTLRERTEILFSGLFAQAMSRAEIVVTLPAGSESPLRARPALAAASTPSNRPRKKRTSKPFWCSGASVKRRLLAKSKSTGGPPWAHAFFPAAFRGQD